MSTRARTNKLINRLMMTTLLLTALMATPAVPGTGLMGTKKAEAACYKVYTIVWSYAGVYDTPGGRQIATVRAGDKFTGPCNYYYADWYRIDGAPGVPGDDYLKRNSATVLTHP